MYTYLSFVLKRKVFLVFTIISPVKTLLKFNVYTRSMVPCGRVEIFGFTAWSLKARQTTGGAMLKVFLKVSRSVGMDSQCLFIYRYLGFPLGQHLSGHWCIERWW